MKGGHVVKGKQDTIPDFGHRLKLARTHKRMKANQLIERLGITSSTYSNWENGVHMPNPLMVVQLARILDVTIDFLYGLERNKAVFTDNLNEEQIETLKSVAEQYRKANARAKDR